MERLIKKLPTWVGYSWTGLSYEERLAGSNTLALYGISLLVVFLCLAALYESWSIPAAVMLVVPLGVLGAVIASSLRGLANDVYFQVALLTTIGLSTKNAILIVEFAKEQHEAGKDLAAAALEAARLRLRPILMTSLAFILGVLPLAISKGAGSGSQNALGTVVIGGMLTGTVLAVFLVPVFFVVVRRFAGATQRSQLGIAIALTAGVRTLPNLRRGRTCNPSVFFPCVCCCSLRARTPSHLLLLPRKSSPSRLHLRRQLPHLNPSLRGFRRRLTSRTPASISPSTPPSSLRRRGPCFSHSSIRRGNGPIRTSASRGTATSAAPASTTWRLASDVPRLQRTIS